MISDLGLIAVNTEPGTITVIENLDIVSLRAAGNYVEVTFDDGRLLHRATLQSVLNKMPECFVQIHRSHVINLKYLKRIQSELGRYTECVMSGERSVSLSSVYFSSTLIIVLEVKIH